MNLKIILKIISIAFILLFIFYWLNNKKERLQVIAETLLKIDSTTIQFKTPSDDVVRIGDGLFSILHDRKTPRDSIKIEVHYGDFFDGNQGVTHYILFKTSNFKLGVRMRYDFWIDKFHIVGYSGMIE